MKEVKDMTDEEILCIKYIGNADIENSAVKEFLSDLKEYRRKRLKR